MGCDSVPTCSSMQRAQSDLQWRPCEKQQRDLDHPQRVTACLRAVPHDRHFSTERYHSSGVPDVDSAVILISRGSFASDTFLDDEGRNRHTALASSSLQITRRVHLAIVTTSHARLLQ